MEIKIGKSARNCIACGKEFAHDEELWSLVRIEDQVFKREDYCMGCWSEDVARGAFSRWACCFYDPKVAEQEPPEVFSPLRQTFYEAVERQARCELAKAYLAAQLLRRQKVFRLIKESEGPDGDARFVLYADRIGGNLVEVRDPNLSYAELENGRQELLARLQELESPEEEREPAVEGESAPEDDGNQGSAQERAEA
ncbi:MAG TPA: hypothetical protein ENN80_11580 [Candidatus Hydrogenedentes bacterium]|nr:hypothetical protein [Candidatus Hydrogenedentota bacterium]